MRLGMPLAEYERTVGPKNRLFHELAEAVLLHKQDILPLHPEDDDKTALDSSSDDEVPTFDIDTHGRN